MKAIMDTEKIYQTLKNKRVCVISSKQEIYSITNTIKTELEKDGIRCAAIPTHINLTQSSQNATNEDIDKFYNGLMLGIIRQLDIGIDFKDWVKQNTRIKPSRSIFVDKFLDMILCWNVSEDVVIFFQGVEELPTEVKNGLLVKLRSVYNKRATLSERGYGRLTFCLLGNIPKAFFEDVNPPFNISFEWFEL